MEPAELTYHMDSESQSEGVTMAIGSIPIPTFMRDAGGCSDPNTVKIAVIDGGIDVDHPDFAYCSSGSFCQGKRFMNPVEQDWGLSTNDHGIHVAGVRHLQMTFEVAP